MNLYTSDHSNDALLLQQLRQGSNDAFNVLYEKYWGQTYANAYKRLKDADQAKDIVQEIFVNIWLRKETQIDNLPAYLNIAVRNQVFKLVEKQKMSHLFLNILEGMPRTYLQADVDIRWKEFYKTYEGLLTTLPPKRQIIFRLRFHEDLTTKDIASQLGLSRKTVQNQLGKAVEQLRIALLHLFMFTITLIVIDNFARSRQDHVQNYLLKPSAHFCYNEVAVMKNQ